MGKYPLNTNRPIYIYKLRFYNLAAAYTGHCHFFRNTKGFTSVRGLNNYKMAQFSFRLSKKFSRLSLSVYIGEDPPIIQYVRMPFQVGNLCREG